MSKTIRTFIIPLDKSIRDDLIEELGEALESGTFGDGLERDYIVGGVHLVGLVDLTDAELVEELKSMVDDDETEVRVQLAPGQPLKLLEEKNGLVVDAKELVEIIRASLRCRLGEVLTEDVIQERANNLAQGLVGVYVQPR